MSRARIADIIELASRLSKVPASAIVARDRRKPIVRIRAAVVIVARKHGHSYPTIARRVGLAEHSTAIHYSRSEGTWRQYDPDFGRMVDRLTEAAARPDALFIGDGVPLPERAVRVAKPAPVRPRIIECTVDDADSGHRAETAIANGSARLGAAIREALAA